MAMNDEETVALIAGGHTFGKTPRRGDRRPRRARAGGCPVEQQGLGWKNSFGTGKGRDTITSGLEGTWTHDADEVGQRLLREPLRPRVGADREPCRREAVDSRRTAPRRDTVPDAHDRSKRRRADDAHDRPRAAVRPRYEPISRRFHEHPDELADAFAKAWYKLLHRDMGPVSRYLGPWVPEPQLWQDPVPPVDHELIDEADIAALKETLLASGLSVSQLVVHRLGVGGVLPRHRQARRRQRRPHPPGPAEGLGGQRAGRAGRALETLEQVQQDFNDAQSGGKKVSLADLIVLGGCAAVEKAAKDAGHDVTVPFRARAHGRLAGADRRRVVRGARAGGRRLPQLRRAGENAPAGARLLLDRANMLKLTAPEMTVLLGGMRALDANSGGSDTACSPTGPGR